VIGGQPPNPRDICRERKSGALGAVLAQGAETRLKIRALIEAEVDEFDIAPSGARASLEDFVTSLCTPEAVVVNFSGGLTQECWTVTRSNGAYRVVFMPKAGYFSLCVVSQFGPLDIGVHGEAIGCFTSV